MRKKRGGRKAGVREREERDGISAGVPPACDGIGQGPKAPEMPSLSPLSQKAVIYYIPRKI